MGKEGEGRRKGRREDGEEINRSTIALASSIH